jgi:hypothetical protein
MHGQQNIKFSNQGFVTLVLITLHVFSSRLIFEWPEEGVIRHKGSGCMTDRQHIPTKTAPQLVVTWPTSELLSSMVTNS